MQNVVLIMKRTPVAQGIMNNLKDSPDIRIIYQPKYKNTSITISNHNAKAALIEVTESGPYGIEYCLGLCKEVRKTTPECKLILMCPEQDEKSIKRVVDAKGGDEIDDFVFYDVTIDYVASKLISI